jgi:hypothetical protein
MSFVVFDWALVLVTGNFWKEIDKKIGGWWYWIRYMIWMMALVV